MLTAAKLTITAHTAEALAESTLATPHWDCDGDLCGYALMWVWMLAPKDTAASVILRAASLVAERLERGQ